MLNPLFAVRKVILDKRANHLSLSLCYKILVSHLRFEEGESQAYSYRQPRLRR
jgi:hypothetical protein